MKEYLIDLTLNFIGYVFIWSAVYIGRKDETELRFLSKQFLIALILLCIGGILIDIEVV